MRLRWYAACYWQLPVALCKIILTAVMTACTLMLCTRFRPLLGLGGPAGARTLHCCVALRRMNWNLSTRPYGTSAAGPWLLVLCAALPGGPTMCPGHCWRRCTELLSEITYGTLQRLSMVSLTDQPDCLGLSQSLTAPVCRFWWRQRVQTYWVQPV